MHIKQNSSLVLLLCGLILSTAISLPVASLFAISDISSEFNEVEIQEYEGQDLSSIDAFRENSIKGPQYIDEVTYGLTITGLVNNELEYTYDEIINTYQSFKKVVTLNCVEGWSATILWEGVLIKDLLEETEISTEANTVIFYAYDGYSTSLPLKYVIENNILMAYKMNNVTLPPERGYPFQLVAESKWGYKWIKWITEIELSNNEEFRGYWELRGYSNEGDLDKSFYGESVNPGSIIPEFPSAAILPILIVIALVVIVFRKKYSKSLGHG